MIVLAVDTATEMVSVALVDGDELLGASEARSERRHAEDLTPMLDFVMKRAGLEFADVDAIAVDVGPGLFTGMRVGIAAAQSLAHVLSVPLVGVDALEAMVNGANGVVGAELVVPTVDARRNEVAWALHRVRDDGSTQRVMAPTVGTREDLVLALRDRAQSCLMLGEYALTHRDSVVAELGPQSWTVAFGDSATAYPHAKHVALLAHARLVRDSSYLDEAGIVDESSSAPRVAALYLREADAEINWVIRSRQ